MRQNIPNVASLLIKQGTITTGQVADKIRFCSGICYICQIEPMWSFDHVKPICKGGSNLIANLKPVCHSCNSRKGGRYPFELAKLRERAQEIYQKKQNNAAAL